MSIKTICTALMALLITASLAQAAEHSAARIDISVKNGKVEFKKPEDKAVRVYYAHWVKDEAQKVKRVCAEKKITDGEWVKFSYTLTPTEDGPLTMSIKGRYSKTLKNWVYYDDVTVEGAAKEVVNGSFEETGGWKFSKGQQVLDESLAHTGKGAVLVWHDKPAYQTVQVKAGEPVTITAWVKFCKQEDKEPK